MKSSATIYIEEDDDGSVTITSDFSPSWGCGQHYLTHSLAVRAIIAIEQKLGYDRVSASEITNKDGIIAMEPIRPKKIPWWNLRRWWRNIKFWNGM